MLPHVLVNKSQYVHEIYKVGTNDFCEIYFVGQFFYSDRSYNGKDACELIYNNKQDITNILLDFNGSFAFIYIENLFTLACVDRVRSYPLYYDDDSKNISTNIFQITSENEPERDYNACKEFSGAGYTLGNKTLLNGIKAIQAGSYIVIRANRLNEVSYFTHTRKLSDCYNAFEAPKDILQISENWCNRLIHSVSGRHILLPISGGYDSRYVACMLKMAGIQNITAYTYGSPGSYEIETSRQVAAKLGYKWTCVYYTPEKWNEFINNKEFNRYLDYSCGGDGIPNLQELIVMNEMKNNGVYDRNSVVVPGYCGDLYGGSYLIHPYYTKKQKLTISWLAEYIIAKHFYFCKFSIYEKSSLRMEIIKTLFGENNEHELLSYDDLVNINEEWFIRHKVAKFVINTLRTFDYFGLEWRIPLWDNELTDYWNQVPNEYRGIKSQLYTEWLFNELFEKMGIGYKKPASYYKLAKISKIKEFVKDVLRGLNTLTGIDIRKSIDVNGYSYVANRLYKKLENRSALPVYMATANACLAQYCIEKFVAKN